jgi:hypothetical protein
MPAQFQVQLWIFDKNFAGLEIKAADDLLRGSRVKGATFLNSV